MQIEDRQKIEKAKKTALDVLLHNMHGAFDGLPRTAGWGYPEPYTRDLMISVLGIAVSENQLLLQNIRNVLVTLAKNQSEHGHIPSLVHDPEDRGASDTTPLFLLAVAIFRKVTGESIFLEEAVQRSLTWMEYQSPSDRYLVGQLPTSDWRDEQWAIGYGLYVNSLTYSYLKLFGQHERAAHLREEMLQFTVAGGTMHHHVHEGLVVKNKPYYAFWAYKVYSSERFDLLGNSIAILSGLAPLSRAVEIVKWIEEECAAMQKKGDLAVDLPPNFFPFMRPKDPDWIPRYMHFNLPGEYHNGGIWPFICGFYIAALVAAQKFELAAIKLSALTALVKNAQNKQLEFGFNEWHKAQDGQVRGQDWQTWSASMYLYAAKCVEERRTPFFDGLNDFYGS
jgi:hypothetical protein